MGKQYMICYDHEHDTINVGATYFGPLGGRYVFFRKSSDDVLRYSRSTTAPIEGYRDGDLYFPDVGSSFDGEILKESEKEYIISVLAKEEAIEKLIFGKSE